MYLLFLGLGRLATRAPPAHSLVKFANHLAGVPSSPSLRGMYYLPRRGDGVAK